MVAREQGNMEAEMKEVSKEQQSRDDRQRQLEQKNFEVREGGDRSAAASAEEQRRELTAADDKRHGSSVPAAQDLDAPPYSGDAPVAATGRKRTKSGRLWKKNRAKSKSIKEGEERQIDTASQMVEELMVTSTATPAVQESQKKAENEDAMRGNSPEPQTESAAHSARGDHQPPSKSSEMESARGMLEHEDERKSAAEIVPIVPSKVAMEWGLCGDDDRGPPVRTPPQRETRGKSKQSQARDQPAPNHQQSLKDLSWKRRLSESKGRHESPRSSSAGVTAEPPHLEKMSEWNRIKALQHSAAAEIASHKNWVPRKGMQRGGEGGGDVREPITGRGKGKQSRELTSQQSQHSKEVARQKFEADLKIKQEELLQRSKQVMKAEFQKAKRIELIRKGRDELEVDLEKNLFCCDGELFYLNK